MDKFFKLSIRLESDELTGPCAPIALSRILKEIAENVEYRSTEPHHSISIMDINGARVGQYKIVEE